jgi:transposase
MGRAESRRLKLGWGTIQAWKRSLKKNGTLLGDALKRLRAALVGAG